MFERLPTRVRLTALGSVALARARHLLRKFADTHEDIGETISGRGGRVRVTAAPLWMRAVVTPAALRFQAACPGVGLAPSSATLAESVRRLAHGAGRPAPGTSPPPSDGRRPVQSPCSLPPGSRKVPHGSGVLQLHSGARQTQPMPQGREIRGNSTSFMLGS